MNVVLVTSMLRPVRDHTIFDFHERLNQTIYSIKTIREKIPNSFVVIIEGGKIEKSEEETFENLADHVFLTDVREYLKSPGEATLLHRYLTSDHFKSLENVENVCKLSGRYYLDCNFDWKSHPNDKTVINFVNHSWLARPMYNTKFYRIPLKHLDNFVRGLKNYIESRAFKEAFPDIEHCFYSYQIIKHEEIYSPEKIGVRGLITGTGKFVIE